MTRDGQLCRPWSYSVIQGKRGSVAATAALPHPARLNATLPHPLRMHAVLPHPALTKPALASPLTTLTCAPAHSPLHSLLHHHRDIPHRENSPSVLNHAAGNMDYFLPRAAQLAESLRASDTPFRYMTQPFVVDFLLDCEESGLNDWREETYGQPLLQCPNASALVMS